MERPHNNPPATAADPTAPAPAWKPDERRFKVFISYSRGDSANFAQELVKALEERGLAAKLDTRDLEFGEKWQAQLKDFIRQADGIVYVVSPASIESRWCRWEVAQVAAQSKRLVPVVHIPVPPEQLPPEIGDVHLFPFTPELDFAACADRLTEGLQKDRTWLQEHTRLTELAYTWAAEQKSRDHLLRGKALRDAEVWMARRPSGAPPPSQAHLDFIAASQVAAKRRTRMWVGGLAVAAVMFAGAAGVAIWQREQARHHLQESLRTESQFRAEQAVRSVNTGDAVTGMLLALEGLGDEQAEDDLQRTRPHVPEAEQALYRAWQAQRERAVLTGHTGSVASAVFSPDGARVLTASADNTARLWEAASGRLLVTLEGHQGPVSNAVFSPDGARVLTADV
jgi:hypothetical protein